MTLYCRCRQRDHPRHTGEDVYSPATFAGLHEQEVDIEDDIDDFLEGIAEEDLADVSSCVR